MRARSQLLLLKARAGKHLPGGLLAGAQVQLRVGGRGPRWGFHRLITQLVSLNKQKFVTN